MYPCSNADFMPKNFVEMDSKKATNLIWLTCKFLLIKKKQMLSHDDAWLKCHIFDYTQNIAIYAIEILLSFCEIIEKPDSSDTESILCLYF